MSLSDYFNLNALKDTYDYICFLARVYSKLTCVAKTAPTTTAAPTAALPSHVVVPHALQPPSDSSWYPSAHAPHSTPA